MAQRKTLYDYAVEYKYSSTDKIEEARKYADDTGINISKALIDTAALSEEEMLELLEKVYNYRAIRSLKNIKLNADLLSKFDMETMVKLRMIPYSFDGILQVLIVNPNTSLMVEDYVIEVLGKVERIEYYLITESNYNKIIDSVGTTNYDLDGLQMSEVTDYDNAVYDVTDDDISAVVTMVNKIFSDAARLNASDIHIEPFEDSMIVRFRIDGILTKKLQTKKGIHSQLVNRIKTMGNMDVNNSRIPQGGRIRLQLYGRQIDMRVSTLPTVFGEKITVRLLDKTSVKFDISMMGFSPQKEASFKNVIQRPSGIILITGPTGSGKSSSLYATMSYLNDISRCIVTLEDPVEYKLPGLVQVQVNNAVQLDFASGLREILRQDPDIILIGEIRDTETAKIAVQASNTGHLVLSTLHTNDAASSVTRLVEMGIEPFLVSSTLNAVISQRLVRRVCERCKKEYQLESDSPYRKALGLKNKEIALFKGEGCDECGGTGYKGRMAVQEFLIIDDDIKEALSRQVTTKDIRDIALKNGMQSIHQDGIEKALAGLTTLDEIHRVLHFDNV